MKGLVAVVVIAAVAAGAWFARDYLLPPPQAGATAGAEQRPAAPVIVAIADREEFVDQIEAIGTTVANESVVLTATVTETIRRLNFEDGQRVKKGDVLIEMTTAEEEAGLVSARATLKEARQQLERVSQLVREGNAPRSRLDEQTALRDTAEAEVNRILAQLEDHVIRAPFDGVLGLRRISPGALVTPGTGIVTLEDISVLKLDFTVPETYLPAVRVGQDIVAESAAFPGQTFRGTISAIEPRVDPVTRAVTVRAKIPNDSGDLRSGMLMTVEVVKDRAMSLMIPEEALVPVGDRQFVFVVDDDHATRKAIETGRRRPGAVEVTAGLDEGARVVVDGAIRISDGSPVNVVAVRGAAARADASGDPGSGEGDKGAMP